MGAPWRAANSSRAGHPSDRSHSDQPMYSSRHRSYRTEAIVLRQTLLGEADRILTLYTQDMGKVRAVAKGVRRPKSRLGGHLELLNRVSVSLSQGRNLDIVAEAQIVESYAGLRSDLQRLSEAVYLAELVDRFTVEGSQSYDVYRMLLSTYNRLSENEGSALLLRHFEMWLLDYSGYRPETHHCLSCRESLTPQDHLFSSASGGVFCPDCRTLATAPLIVVSLAAMKVLRLLQREQRYDDVADVAVSNGTMVEVDRVLKSYIRYLIEAELKSARFLDLVSSPQPSPTTN